MRSFGRVLGNAQQLSGDHTLLVTESLPYYVLLSVVQSRQSQVWGKGAAGIKARTV